MDDDTRKKLAEVLEKKKQVDATIAAAKREKDERAAQHQRDKADTDTRWPEAVHQIRGAVESVNEMIADQDVNFEVGSFKGGEADRDKYGGLPVYLRQPGAERERYIYLNISAVGHVSPVFSIPHSGKNPPGFKLRDGSSEKYAAILTNFLSQVISYAETVAKMK